MQNDRVAMAKKAVAAAACLSLILFTTACGGSETAVPDKEAAGRPVAQDGSPSAATETVITRLPDIPPFEDPGGASGSVPADEYPDPSTAVPADQAEPTLPDTQRAVAVASGFVKALLTVTPETVETRMDSVSQYATPQMMSLLETGQYTITVREARDWVAAGGYMRDVEILSSEFTSNSRGVAVMEVRYRCKTAFDADGGGLLQQDMEDSIVLYMNDDYKVSDLSLNEGVGQ